MYTEIREFKKEDIEEWDRLMAESFPRKKDFCSAKWMHRYWKDIKGWILVNEADEWIGATTILDNYKSELNDGGVHFLELCVLPKYRNGIYALMLVKQMFDYSIGRTKTADVNPNNKLMTTLISAFGFVETKRTASWVRYVCDKNHYPKELKELSLIKIMHRIKNNNSAKHFKTSSPNKSSF